MQTVEPNATPIDPMALRRAFGTFVTGVTVVTTCDADGQPRGMTANSFTSVSLDPALLLVCIGKSASSYDAFAHARCVAVNLLHEGQVALSKAFASKSSNKFDQVSHVSVHTGAPVLTDCLTWFDCSVAQIIDAGDHIILLAQVQAFGTTPEAPLAFCRGRYAQVKDPLPAGWLSASDMVTGYLIEAQGHVLLASDGKGGWVLPSASRRLKEGRLPLAAGGELALLPDDTFLYSVFDTADADPGYLIYRAKLAEPLTGATLPPGLQYFALDQLPYDAITSHEIRSLLQRYARETAGGSFGIYMDSQEGGRVAMVGNAQHWDNLH